MNEEMSNARSSLQTTGFDRVNSLLCSALGLVGLLVFGMFLVWMVNDFRSPFESTESGNVLEFPADNDDRTESSEDMVEDEVERRSFEEMLQLVSATTSELSNVIAGGMNGDDRRSTTKRPGDPDPDPVGVVRKWEVRYEVASLDEYARQLDFFGIELGAVSLDDNRIVRIGGLSEGRSQAMSDRADEQETVYFAHKQPRLKAWDRRMVDSESFGFEFEVVHLFPEQITAQMGKAELDYVSSLGREEDEILKTLFELHPEGDGWKIRVAKMEFNKNGKVQ